MHGGCEWLPIKLLGFGCLLPLPLYRKKVPKFDLDSAIKGGNAIASDHDAIARQYCYYMQS